MACFSWGEGVGHCVWNWRFVSLVHWIVHLGFWILVNLVECLEFGILVEGVAPVVLIANFVLQLNNNGLNTIHLSEK